MGEDSEVKKTLVSISIISTFLVMGTAAHAALTVQGTDTLGNKLIYDSDFDITWYDYSASPATWLDQLVWADGLTVDFNGTILDDWRLPTFPDTDWVNVCLGDNCTDNEMGHLFYEDLGNSANNITNAGDFDNLLASRYWTDTPHWSKFLAYAFNLGTGYQHEYEMKELHAGIAVREGNVTVPIPGAALLLGSGLAGLIGMKKRFKK
jgi:hypothetical protein